jgi:hypothetical protein
METVTNERLTRNPKTDLTVIHYVAFCCPTEHKPRGDRAREDYGKMSDEHTQ